MMNNNTAKIMDKMPQKPKIAANMGNFVKRAIRNLGEQEGSSFANIKKQLASLYQTNGDMPDPAIIKQYLSNAVAKGALLKLDNGKYKVKDTARRRKSRSRSRSKGKSRRRSKSRKRSGGRKRSRSAGKKLRRSSSGKRRRRRKSKAPAGEDE